MLTRNECQSIMPVFVDWREKIPRDSIYWKIREWVYTHVKDEDFSSLYSDRGRRSIPPTRILAAIMLQLTMGLSDRKLEEASRYDDRVKLVLNIDRNGDPLDAVTLCRIRGKFMDSDVGAKLLHKTLTSAIEEGVLPRETTAIVDSFLISGAGATQDTITLIRRAMAKVIMLARCFELEEPIVRVLERKDYLEKGKPKIDWGDPEEKRALVESLVKDARRVVEAVSHLEGVPGELKQAAQLLHRVAEQDIEEKDGKIQIRRGVARDRIVSVTDPEMRHGHKTTSKRADGYKGKVTVVGEHGDFVGAVGVDPANEPDNTGLGDLIDEQESCGVQITKLKGDTSFGDMDTREEMEQRGIDLIAKLPPASNKEGYFSKDDFELNLDEMWARCPAGQVTYKTRKARDHKGRKAQFFVFDNQACSICPLRDKCVRGSNPRTVRIGYYEKKRAAAKMRQASSEFQEEYRKRSYVERAIAWLTGHGARQARYIGREKTRFQLQIIAAVHNIVALYRNLARKTEPVGAMAG